MMFDNVKLIINSIIESNITPMEDIKRYNSILIIILYFLLDPLFISYYVQESFLLKNKSKK
jgi:hypothetical protein